MIRRHPTTWLATSLGVAFALLGAGAVAAGMSVGAPAPSVTPTVAPTPTATEDPPRPVPAAIPEPQPLRTCSIAGLAEDQRLGDFRAHVINAETGEVLFDRDGGEPGATASVLKTLTAAAALAELGHDHRMRTLVVEGAEPGSVVLVGGGDPTLSRLSSGKESFYTGAPKLGDLARQTIDAWTAAHPDQPISRVVLDATLWNPEDSWIESWKTSERSAGYHPFITALMVDGDRTDPTRSVSSRGEDPIGTAGEAFLDALIDSGGSAVDPAVEIVRGQAPEESRQLAEVRSQPVSTLIGQMLRSSDNTIAEALVRQISLVSGGDGSSGSVGPAVRAALDAYGIDTAALTILDGSGLSPKNAVPASYVAQLMVQVREDVQGLGVIYDSLPISGQSGTLASRFTGDNAIARGAVVAKTGWIGGGYTLAGVINAKDGTPLTFAFYALGEVTDSARNALDTITTAAYLCGNNLSNS